jgi:hypothetical protein
VLATSAIQKRITDGSRLAQPVMGICDTCWNFLRGNDRAEPRLNDRHKRAPEGTSTS